MCQAQPGPRCYNDSNKKLVKLNAKLTKAEGELADAQKQLAAAARKSDFNAYSKLRKTVSVLEEKAETLRTTCRHTQRDVDSTLTGRKAIESAIQTAASKQELDQLDIRRRTAEALRFNREHALALQERAYVPAIRFAS